MKRVFVKQREILPKIRRDFRENRCRKGVAVVTVLACAMVVAMLGLVTLELLLSHSRQQRVEKNRLQSEWIAESALNRAAARVASEPEYRGEVWQITADELGGFATGEARIQIENQQVNVTARYPVDALPAITTSRSMQIQIPAGIQ